MSALRGQFGLDETGVEPAEVGEPVQIPDDLRVDGLAFLCDLNDAAFGATADGPCEVEGGGAGGGPGGGPMVEADFVTVPVADRERFAKPRIPPL